MSGAQKAVFADAQSKLLIRTDIGPHEPADNELLINVQYTGVNPADVRHATALGINSTVLGYDFSGRVVKAPAQSKFKQGDIIAGYTPTGIPRPAKYGAYQHQLVAPENMVFSIPANLPETHAAALAVVSMTAADALYNLFGFPLPTNPGKFDSPILIWGASSGVGITAVQFARASGYRNIITTSSPGRFDLLKRLGAAHLFDYSSPTVVEDICAKVEEIGQGPITHALDSIGSGGRPMSSQLVLDCVDDSATLACTTIAVSKRFKMPVAMTHLPFQIKPPGAPGVISIPARPADHWNAWKAFEWAIQNYGSAFELPAVEVIEATAEQALEEANKVANGARGFGKRVFKMPFKWSALVEL